MSDWRGGQDVVGALCDAERTCVMMFLSTFVMIDGFVEASLCITLQM